MEVMGTIVESTILNVVLATIMVICLSMLIGVAIGETGSLKKKAKPLLSKIDSLKDEASDLRGKMLTKASENIDLSNENKLLRLVKEDLEKSNEKLKTVNTKFYNLSSVLQKTSDEQYAKISDMTVVVRDLETERDSLKRSIVTHKGNYTRLKAKYDSLKIAGNTTDMIFVDDPLANDKATQSYPSNLLEYRIPFGKIKKYKPGDVAIWGGNSPAIGVIKEEDYLTDCYRFVNGVGGRLYDSLHISYLRPATDVETVLLCGGSDTRRLPDTFRKDSFESKRD